MVTAVVATVILALVLTFRTQLASLVTQPAAVLLGSVPKVEQVLPRAILASRLMAAEDELARTRYQALLYQSLAEENAELKKLVALADTGTISAGEVVGRPPQTHYDTLLVRLGPDALVAVGDRAIVWGIPVGTVTSLTATTALVSLYSMPGATVDARAGTPTAIVVMTGQGGGAFTFDIPSEVALLPGDIVEAAAGAYPLAVVARVVVSPDSTSATVYAHAPINTHDVRFVEFEHPQ